MPIDPKFSNDVFISYAGDDREWAKRLSTDLGERGLDVFFDATSLRAGPRWDRQLRQAVASSRHLVIFKSSIRSDWVDNELANFDAERTRAGVAEDVRAPIVVMLEGEWKPGNPYQMVFNLRDADGAYANGADACPDDLWRGVVDEVERSIRYDDARRPVPLLLVTTTRERIEAIPPDERRGDRWSLADFSEKLGFESVEKLSERYGASRRDWRPFNSDIAIAGVLQALQDNVNAELAAPARFRWEYVDEDLFWGSPRGAMSAAGKLRSGPALIVVDPVALHDDLVDERYGQHMNKALQNPEALELVLAPVEPSTSTIFLRQRLEQVANRSSRTSTVPGCRRTPSSRESRSTSPMTSSFVAG